MNEAVRKEGSELGNAEDIKKENERLRLELEEMKSFWKRTTVEWALNQLCHFPDAARHLELNAKDFLSK